MQHKKSLLWISSLVILFTAVIGISSCKKKFDDPPAAGDPNLTVTHTIKDFKAMHTVAGAFDFITEDIVIAGTVIANDKSGNIYKQIYIKDETGALAVNLDALSVYASYPVGRKVFIKCKGLYLTDDNKMIQLGMKSVIAGVPSAEGIPSGLVGNYLVGGSLNNEVEPIVVTPTQLGTGTISMQNEYIGQLIQLENYEFVAAEVNRTYADTSSYKNTVNLNVRNCSGAASNLIVRTSGFASFAGINVPDGNGTLKAIYTVFGNTKQLILRDTSDVEFTGNRCDGTIPGGDVPFISIAALRALHGGVDKDIASNRIKGIVISDAKNIGAGNIVLQDGNAGIDLFFGTAAAGALSAFKVGDSLVIDISGGSLEAYNDMLEVVLNSSAVPTSAAGTAATGSGKSVVPVTRTIAEIGTNMASIENTLVTIVNATASGGATYADGTFAGNRTLTDATGAMTLRTIGTATFGATALPTTCQNWVGYVSRFTTTNQIYIRTLADVTAGTNCTVTPPPTGEGISLGTTSPLLLDFNGIGAGLPKGVTVKTAATATALGTDATFNASATPTPNINIWTKTNGGFKNLASAINPGFSVTTDSATQSTATDRAIGVRQVSGTDKGVAFVFQIDNTTGKNNVVIEFLLQSLDETSPRAMTWVVDYAVGDAPTSFTPASTSGTVTTGGNTFSNNTVTASFAGAIDNKTDKVWIRITTLAGSAATPTGNRPTTAIDNFKVSWN